MENTNVCDVHGEKLQTRIRITATTRLPEKLYHMAKSKKRHANTPSIRTNTALQNVKNVLGARRQPESINPGWQSCRLREAVKSAQWESLTIFTQRSGVHPARQESIKTRKAQSRARNVPPAK